MGYSPWGCRVGHDLATERQQVREPVTKGQVLDDSISVKCPQQAYPWRQKGDEMLPGAGVRWE